MSPRSARPQRKFSARAVSTNGSPRAASAAARTRSTASSKSWMGAPGFPVASSIDPPTSPTPHAIRTVSAQTSGAAPNPSSRSADTGSPHAATIAPAFPSTSPRPSPAKLSRRPTEKANPALVVASASNPRLAKSRADPASHGFGITNAPSLSCSALNRSYFAR